MMVRAWNPAPLVKARRSRGIQPVDVYRAVGKSKQWWHGVENGRHMPSIRDLVIAMRILRMNRREISSLFFV